jgi:hypothetical protein
MFVRLIFTLNLNRKKNYKLVNQKHPLYNENNLQSAKKLSLANRIEYY